MGNVYTNSYHIQLLSTAISVHSVVNLIVVLHIRIHNPIHHEELNLQWTNRFSFCCFYADGLWPATPHDTRWQDDEEGIWA